MNIEQIMFMRRRKNEWVLKKREGKMVMERAPRGERGIEDEL